MVVENVLEGEAIGSLKNEKKHRLKQRFDVRVKLGQGTYGKVQLAVNRESGQEVAIKTIKKSKIESDQDLIRIRREIQIMSSIQHPHIIHIYEVFENKDKIVLVMQFASGGELYDFLSQKKVLSDLEARRIFRQIAAAVYYCHKNKICHRDLKLENILLDEKGNAKIADFGLSNVFDERHMLKTYCGSPLYASPEIVKGVPYYGPEVDCWSMGVLLYTLVYGAMPFDGSNFKKLVTQISEGDYFEPKKKSKASDLIRRLLTVNPVKRATIVDICTDYWVNQGYEHSLLQVAEDMANLTPVRLDLLLALAPESPVPSGDEELPEEKENVGAEPHKSESKENFEGEEDDDDEEEDDEENQDSAANSFAFVRGSQISNFTVSTPDLQKAFESEDNSDHNAENLCTDAPPAASGKRIAEKSTDSISKVSSQSKPVSKKSRKSNSTLMSTSATLNSQKVITGVDSDSSSHNSAFKPDSSENHSVHLEKTELEDLNAIKEHLKEDSGLNRSECMQSKHDIEKNSSGNSSESAVPNKQQLRAGRAPGKIVIPKTFESPQSTPSPKSQCSKSPPVISQMQDSEKPFESQPSSEINDTNSEGKTDNTKLELCSREPDSASEEKKTIAKGILKKGIARAKLAERKLSQQSSTESEIATPPVSSVKSSDILPSFYKSPRPYVKGEETQVKSRAEIVLSPSDKGSTREPVSVAQQDAPLWNNSSSGCYQQKQNTNSNWVAVSSSLDSEMSGWREQVEESLRRLSPDGSTEKSSSPVSTSRNDDEKSLVPIARSYKKFTFTKDGACITETKKIYASPGADGSWTKVEKKTKITTRPGNAEEFERFRDLHLRNSSPLTRSDSQSSSGSNEVYDDIFDSWTGDSMMCNMMKIRDMFQRFSRESFFQKERRRNPFRRFHRAESNRERSKSRSDAKSGYSTDRDSSDVDDDCNVDVSGSNPVMYGSQGLWQFLRPPSRLRSSRCVIDAQPDRISFTRSTSHERSGSKLSNFKQCESRASSGYNTGSRSQSRDRTQSPREKVLRFIFESPSKEFDDHSLAKKDSWCFRKGNLNRDSGVNSDGYESEQSHQGVSSDKYSKSGRYSPISTACNSSRESMIRDFVKSWPKEKFMNTSFHKEMLQEAADNRRHKVEQWLHMNNVNDDNFPFDFPGDSHARVSSKNDISSGYATMRPREYVRYARSSSDKISGRDIDRFSSFAESSKSRMNIHSPVSEESTRGSYSPHTADRSSSSTPVHHINLTFSDGRATANPNSATRISFDKPTEDISASNNGSIRIHQVSTGRSALPMVQMRVSFNRGNISPTSSLPSAGLWQQKDQSSGHKSLGSCETISNRETSPLPGIKKFSTEMVHTVGGDGNSVSEKTKRHSIGPSIECEVKASVKNSSGKGKIQQHASSIWCDTASFHNNELSEASCMVDDNTKIITNLDSKSNQPLSDSESFSKGENTPDSLEDILSESNALDQSASHSSEFAGENETLLGYESQSLKVKPLGVLWSSFGSVRENQDCVTSDHINTPSPVRSLSSPGCCCAPHSPCFDMNCKLVNKQMRGTSTEIGSIWEQRNNNRTDDLVFSCGGEGNCNYINSDQSIGCLENFDEVDNFGSSISSLTVLGRLPVIGTYKPDEIPKGKNVPGTLPSFMEDLQSPKQVLHQALRISKSLKSCE